MIEGSKRKTENYWEWKCLYQNQQVGDQCFVPRPPECGTGEKDIPWGCDRGTVPEVSKTETNTHWRWKCQFGNAKAIEGYIYSADQRQEIDCQKAKDSPECGDSLDTCVSPAAADATGVSGDSPTHHKWGCTLNNQRTVCREPKDPKCGSGIDTCIAPATSDAEGASGDTATLHRWGCTLNGKREVCEFSKEPDCGNSVYTCAAPATSDATDGSGDSATHHRWGCNLNSQRKVCEFPRDPECGNTVYTCAAPATSDATDGSGDSATHHRWGCSLNGKREVCTKFKGPKCGDLDTCVAPAIADATGASGDSNEEHRWGCSLNNQRIICTEFKAPECNNTVRCDCNPGTPLTGFSSCQADTDGVADTETDWKWKCELGGQTTDICQKAKPVQKVDGECNTERPYQSKNNVCKEGTQSTFNVSSSGHTHTWTWTCQGINNGNNAQCSATCKNSVPFKDICDAPVNSTGCHLVGSGHPHKTENCWSFECLEGFQWNLATRACEPISTPPPTHPPPTTRPPTTQPPGPRPPGPPVPPPTTVTCTGQNEVERNGVCECEGGHRRVGGNCLPTCGTLCGDSNAIGVCASGNSCSDTTNYHITQLSSNNAEGKACCKREPIDLNLCSSSCGQCNHRATALDLSCTSNCDGEGEKTYEWTCRLTGQDTDTCDGNYISCD